jgi:hypothetical protein
MTQPSEEVMEACGCTPFAPEVSDGDVCGTCAPNLALSFEEEAILGKMRAFKEQVRPITGRLKELQGGLGETAGSSAEWIELSARLEALRTEWKDWEFKLDEAIENKLITLGHRPPRE